MNKDSRESNSIRNFTVGVIYQVVFLMLNLFSKTFFIKTLGTTYLGINGLFTNIFLVLSFAEHGIGPVMMYTLYGPLSEKNKNTVSMIYSYFQKFYKRMAVVIGLAGLLMLPLLPFLINTKEQVSHVQLAFLLFLAGIVFSNLFAYKTHLVISDQKQYVVGMYQFIFDVLALILQILILIYTQNYLLYLVIFLIKNMIYADMISRLVKKLYPFITKQPESADFLIEKQKIVLRIQNIIAYRLSRVLLTGTDNVLISVLVGTIWVGYYSNYDLIVVGVLMLVSTFYSAISASVGNFLAKETLEEQNRLYDIIQTIGFWIVAFTTTCLIILFQDFITIWLGETLLMKKPIVYIIVINYYLVSNRNIVKVFRNAAGIFERIKYMMMFAAAMNIVLSIVLGIYFGVVGILIATTLTTLSTFYWYEAKIILVEKLGRSFSVFIKNQVIVLILTLSSMAVTAISVMLIEVTGIMTFILKMMVCVVISNVFLVIMLRKTEAYKVLKTIVKRILVKGLG